MPQFMNLIKNQYMNQIEIPLMLEKFDKNSGELAILKEALSCRKTAEQLIAVP